MKRYYAGIGARKTPFPVLQFMEKVAEALEKQGWILRSGGAEGADSAFERGVKAMENKQIFRANQPICEAAFATVDRYHPSPDRLGTFPRRLMARNAYQVLGPDFGKTGENLQPPSSMVICWTPDGCRRHSERLYGTGGTGQAISIADDKGIKVFNLRNQEDVDAVCAIAGIEVEKFPLF